MPPRQASADEGIGTCIADGSSGGEHGLEDEIEGVGEGDRTAVGGEPEGDGRVVDAEIHGVSGSGEGAARGGCCSVGFRDRGLKPWWPRLGPGSELSDPDLCVCDVDVEACGVHAVAHGAEEYLYGFEGADGVGEDYVVDAVNWEDGEFGRALLPAEGLSVGGWLASVDGETVDGEEHCIYKGRENRGAGEHGVERDEIKCHV